MLFEHGHLVIHDGAHKRVRREMELTCLPTYQAYMCGFRAAWIGYESQTLIRDLNKRFESLRTEMTHMNKFENCSFLVGLIKCGAVLGAVAPQFPFKKKSLRIAKLGSYNEHIVQLWHDLRKGTRKSICENVDVDDPRFPIKTIQTLANAIHQYHNSISFFFLLRINSISYIDRARHNYLAMPYFV
jgi:hypothetical protein